MLQQRVRLNESAQSRLAFTYVARSALLPLLLPAAAAAAKTSNRWPRAYIDKCRMRKAWYVQSASASSRHDCM